MIQANDEDALDKGEVRGVDKVYRNLGGGP